MSYELRYRGLMRVWEVAFLHFGEGGILLFREDTMPQENVNAGRNSAMCYDTGHDSFGILTHFIDRI